MDPVLLPELWDVVLSMVRAGTWRERMQLRLVCRGWLALDPEIRLVATTPTLTGLELHVNVVDGDIIMAQVPPRSSADRRFTYRAFASPLVVAIDTASFWLSTHRHQLVVRGGTRDQLRDLVYAMRFIPSISIWNSMDMETDPDICTMGSALAFMARRKILAGYHVTPIDFMLNPLEVTRSRQPSGYVLPIVLEFWTDESFDVSK